MAYNKIQALRDNIAAIETALQVRQSSTGIATIEQRAVLKKFSGFGGINEILCIKELVADRDDAGTVFAAHDVYDDSMQLALLNLKAVIEAMAGGNSERALSIAESVAMAHLTSFYTPQPVIDAVGDAVRTTLDTMGIKGTSLLETSAGIGGFLSIATTDMDTLVAFEKDEVTALILAALHPGVSVVNGGFESIDVVRNNYDDIPDVFDIVASNIPFADMKVLDTPFEKKDEAHRRAVQKLHTYFFLKGMEQLEDGGILAFITTRGIADSHSNAYLRQWLVEHGDLLAVLRLPDNLFEGGYGKEIGSDLIIFQRNSHKAWLTTNERMFCETLHDKTVIVDDKYYQVEGVNRLLCQAKQAIFTHRKVDTNQYGRKVINYYWREGMDKFEFELRSRLMHDMERSFKQSTWAWGHDEERKRREREASERQSEKIRKGREAHEKKVKEMRPFYDALMSAYNDLMTNERRDQVADDFGREDLNEAYDKLVSEFGPLHKNESVIRHYPEPALALSLERQEGKKWVKADVFTKPVAFHVHDADERVSPMDALSMSLSEFGRVKIRFMMDRTGMSEAQLYDALRGEIFFYPDPDAENLNEAPLVWLHKHNLLNGNVVAKRKRGEEYRAIGGLSDFDGKALDDSIQALSDATPVRIPYDDIDLQLGQTWMPLKFYNRFVMELFECGNVNIEYLKHTNTFSFRWPYSDMGLGSEIGPWAACGGEYNGFKVFELALQDVAPQCKKTVEGEDGKSVSVDDDEKRREVQAKIDDMKLAYIDFMHSSSISAPERQQIEDLYNDTFNCLVRAPFDGSMLTLPGLDFSQLPFDSLYQSQKDCIWAMINNYGGIGWHEVGAGKTQIMVCLTHELKRMGMSNKPMIIGMKANCHQIYETYRKSYPNARILYPGKDFNEKNLSKVFSQIANNDWDCIILTHNQFKRLPQSLEVQKSIIDQECRELDEVMRISRNSSDITREAWRGLEKRRNNLKIELSKVMEAISNRDADSIDFSQMGIDFLAVDESQVFKNLQFATRHGRVAGIGKTDGNQTTLNLLLAIRTIQRAKKRDLCAAFFSGTIIVNALTELYAVFKYLRPRALEDQGIYCFDTWASQYCRKSSDYDLTVTGEVKQKERFREYINVPELSQFLREITDYRTAEMINLDRPKGNFIEDFADPTREQSVLLDRLKTYAASGNWSVLDLHEKENHYGKKGLQFATTNLARDISMDSRMLGEHQFNDDPQNKASRCAMRIAHYYRKYDAHKGTQFVFCDVSVEHRDGKWNIYSDVKQKLIEQYGIPANEIRFVQDVASNESARKKLFDDMNAGKVRVVFGTTVSLGTGVNAQQRAVAAHHLDIPWRPADLEQRNGRAIRKGNEVKFWGDNTVDVIIYGTNRTLDAYKFKLLQNKNLFITQINQGTVASRHYDDGAIDGDENGGGMPYAEFVALLSGNTDLLTKAKLDGRIAVLEKQRQSHIKAVTKAKIDISKRQNEIEMYRNKISLQKSDLADAKAFLDAHGDAGLNVFGAKEQTVEEQGRKLFEYRGETHTSPGIFVGTVYNGYNVHMQSVLTSFTGELAYNCFDVYAKSGLIYECRKNGTLGLSFDDAVHSFDGLPLAIEKRIADNEIQIQYAEKDIVALQATVNSTWSHEAELADLKRQLSELQARIDASLKATEAAKVAEAAKVSEAQSED